MPMGLTVIEKNLLLGSKFFNLRADHIEKGDKNENLSVAFPENISTHPKDGTGKRHVETRN